MIWIETPSNPLLRITDIESIAAVAHETEYYRRQHPVGFASWPTLDPLHHPTEATAAEEALEEARQLGAAYSMVALPLAQAGAASGQVVDPDGDNLLSLADTTRAQRINLRKTRSY